jgi:hypothetical protein
LVCKRFKCLNGSSIGPATVGHAPAILYNWVCRCGPLTADARRRSRHPVTKAMKAILTAIILVFAVSSYAADTPLTEFITQILEPTGGKISRPKDWFYHEGHRGPVYDWMLTREDTDNGKKPYTTGVRIQTFTGVKKGTGKTAKQFIIDFLASKKKEVAKVIKTCEPKEQYLFTRICLETEEGPHHILYSLYWGTNDLDIAVVTIAGTTKELWPTYEAIFNKNGRV